MQAGWGCGYVAIPEGHKYYGVPYYDIPVDVHGGLTYSNHYHDGEMPDGFSWPEDFKGHWIVGFDTAHYGDNLITCSESYVEDQTQRLAEQLEAL